MIVYGQPYLSGLKWVKPFIDTPALHPFSIYVGYIYCATFVSDRPIRPLSAQKSKAHADAWLSVFRRTALFADTTGLKPININKSSSGFKTLDTRVNQCIHCDHVTYWRSPLGSNFILNEPYFIESDYQEKLLGAGLVSIVVPTNLSPYCGKWNPAVGATPGTTSYLICDKAHVLELMQIDSLLTAGLLNAPEWNDTAEVHMYKVTELLSHGVALIPIPRGCKGPITSGWNEHRNVITSTQLATSLLGLNIGIAHAY